MAGILAGRVAVVTGGGTGIGEAVSRLFANEGAKVVVVGRRKEPLDRVARDIGGLAVPTDIADEAAVKAMYAACVAAHGRLDILINNAGTPGIRVAVEEMPVPAWDESIAINVRGLALCTKHAVPLMRKQGKGAIVNIVSRTISRNRSDYMTGKYARYGITESAAFELGQYGIRVNGLRPGAVDTDMFRGSLKVWARNEGISEEEYARTRFIEPCALRRMIKPEEIASCALFLASDAASAITGTTIQVNGGRLT